MIIPLQRREGEKVRTALVAASLRKGLHFSPHSGTRHVNGISRPLTSDVNGISRPCPPM